MSACKIVTSAIWDRRAAKAFWSSSEYAEAKKPPESLAAIQVLLIDRPEFSA